MRTNCVLKQTNEKIDHHYKPIFNLFGNFLRITQSISKIEESFKNSLEECSKINRILKIY